MDCRIGWKSRRATSSPTGQPIALALFHTCLIENHGDVTGFVANKKSRMNSGVQKKNSE